MTEENTITETATDGGSTVEDVSKNVDTGQEQAPAADEFTDLDREKLSEVVRKERAAAKAQATRADTAEKRLAELEATELRRSVAEERGLTSAQAAFLTGDTAEEMAASADALRAAFPDRPNALGRIQEGTLRTGATGITHPGPSASEVADRVLD